MYLAIRLYFDEIAHTREKQYYIHNVIPYRFDISVHVIVCPYIVTMFLFQSNCLYARNHQFNGMSNKKDKKKQIKKQQQHFELKFWMNFLE